MRLSASSFEDSDVVGQLPLSDSLEAVELLRSSNASNAEDERIVGCCKELISRSWVVEVRHILRVANKIADKVARTAMSQWIEALELFEPPSELSDMLEDDARGDNITPSAVGWYLN